MKEEEGEGEELINIEEEENARNQKTNKKKSNFKNRSILFIISSLLILIILIYFIKHYENYFQNKKVLIIFDFDKTLTKKDVFEEQRFLLPTKEEQEEIMDKLYYENWTLLMSSFYEKIYDLNITISDINNCIDKIEYISGMIELLKYFYENKNKYSLIILSAGHYIQVLRMLERFNLTNFFDEIIAIPSYIENGKIIIIQEHKYDCDICNAGQCKTYEYNLLIDKFKKNKNIIFNKVYYICDGLNDYCLARNLKENDVLLVRKGFTLYKGLYDEGMINNIKCKISSWNDGYEIIKYFQEKEK